MLWPGSAIPRGFGQLLAMLTMLGIPTAATARDLVTNGEMSKIIDAAIASGLKVGGPPGWAPDKPLTVSLTILKTGAEAGDLQCIPALTRDFERQMEALGRISGGRVTATRSAERATIALVLGNLTAANAEIRNLGLDEKRNARARETSVPTEGRRTSAAFPHYPGQHEMEGMYIASDGTLLAADALIDWGTPRARDTCKLSFVETIVELIALDSEKRLSASEAFLNVERVKWMGGSAENYMRANLACVHILSPALPTTLREDCAARILELN